MIEWYPKEKIQYVKRKLKGENPAFITRYCNVHYITLSKMFSYGFTLS